MTISQSKIKAYQKHLVSENRADSSIKEYVRYANRFAEFVGKSKLSKRVVVEYRRHIDENYTTYNSKNNSVAYANSLLKFLGKDELAIPYFESSRVGLKIKTPALTDEDITKLLNYAENYKLGCDSDGYKRR